MKNIFIAFVLGLSSVGYSQTDYSFVYDSDSFLRNGIQLYDEGKYQEAIKAFDKIVKNDPKFYTAQYEKALALAAGEDKEAAKAFYEDAYNKGYMKEDPSFYMAYGSLLSDQKDYDKAEKMFFEALKIYPNSSRLLYNLALLYLRKEERQKCVDYLEKAISINPNHAGSHYLIGMIALEDGRVTEGSMALLAYLSLINEGEGCKNAILKLNAKFSENYLEKSKLTFSKSGDNFEEIDVILRNSLPLKSAYKVNSTIDDVITRQVQAIAEYAVEHKMENGFFETTYVPWLADIVKKKQFEGFSYHILLGMKEQLGKKLTSQNKKMTAFNETYLSKDFWQVFARRNVDLFGKQEQVIVYLKNNRPYLLGKEENGKKVGKYKVLNEEGNMISELNLINDELDGLQKYYDNKGKLTEENNYSKGKVEGKRTKYYENGNIEFIENYKNDLLDGISTTYYVNGGKSCEVNFVNNERDGALICFYENGTKKSEINYSKGKVNGNCVQYDEAGNISKTYSYTMDEVDGKVYEYFNGKVLKSEIEYKAGKITSPYKVYYPDGILKEETTYQNNNPATLVSNLANGKKSYETLYDKEGYVATNNYFNGNDALYFQETYNKKGEIKTALQFETGNSKPTDIPVSKGTYLMKNIEGSVLIKGGYEKGKKKGEWSYFYNTGALSKKENYENGILTGLAKTYNMDERPSSVFNYVNDTISGVYESYGHGALSNIYHYKNGQLNGPHKSFHSDGSVSQEDFYINGELYKSISYWQNGNVNFVTSYMNSSPVKLETYNSDGKKFNEIDYTNKNEKITVALYGGTEIHEYTLKNGVFEGKYIIKNKNGKIISDNNYINGVRHGKQSAYGPTGALISERSSYSGKADGIGKYYDIAGNIRMSDTDIFGSNTGLSTRYYHNKGKYLEYNQHNGNIEGEVKYYNQKGDNILILGYQNAALLYYIKLDKNGKLTEKTPVVGQTAKIISSYPNGKTAIEINFVKGNNDGKLVVNNQEGRPEYEINYDMGFLTGPRIEYYANGKIYKKENFKNSNFEGLQEFFKEDGKPWITAEYKNDELHGLCKIYTNGIVSQTQRYDSDALVEISK
ncbi:antitoxin component YwqK of YwqJK toxin-antitoxin module/Tfp pilus assembly protein PilF [Flavobacterium sp. 28YEA47A]|uniref:tetratricopeptide repeat protein n=1 Tax=Flavobacterium sp. 28YEA47A TaxID=3156276 RepID=UPI003518BFB2